MRESKPIEDVIRAKSPTGTWRLGSYQPVDRRAKTEERHQDVARKVERRWGPRRALRSLLRL